MVWQWCGNVVRSCGVVWQWRLVCGGARWCAVACIFFLWWWWCGCVCVCVCVCVVGGRHPQVEAAVGYSIEEVSAERHIDVAMTEHGLHLAPGDIDGGKQRFEGTQVVRVVQQLIFQLPEPRERIREAIHIPASQEAGPVALVVKGAVRLPTGRATVNCHVLRAGCVDEDSARQAGGGEASAVCCRLLYHDESARRQM